MGESLESNRSIWPNSSTALLEQCGDGWSVLAQSDDPVLLEPTPRLPISSYIRGLTLYVQEHGPISVNTPIVLGSPESRRYV